MNIINDLLKGKKVEWKTLGEICKIETGKLNANAHEENGKYPFFTTAKDISKINTYRWDTEALLIAGNANVGDVKHYIGKFNAYQRTYVLRDFSDVSVKFLYHYISSYLKIYLESNKNEAAMTYIVLNTLKKFEIPIPPLSVQEKIAEILDRFTQLEAELEAELVLRKKQYNYYRNHLLTPDENSLLNGKKVEWKTLGEVGQFIRGNGLQKKDFTESGVPAIHYGQIYTKYGNKVTETISFVSEELAKKLRKASKNDLIIAGVSENIEDICKCLVWKGEEDVCVSGDTFIFKTNQNADYIGHLLRTNDFFHYKKKYAVGTKVTRLQAGKLPEYKIPIPPMEEQERIAGILDKFDTLVNSISEGLPKEIELRRKQYEYYREKLLSFQ